MSKSILGDGKLEILRQAVLETKMLPGDMAELGVYQGGTAKMMLENASGKTIHLFDTFEGMPFQGSEDVHKKGEFADCIDPNDLLEELKDYKVVIYKGIFPDDRFPFHARFSCVHLDADQFQSTLDGLKHFGHRMVVGGLMVCDDWEWRNCPGVKEVILQWLPTNPNFSYNVIGHQALIRRNE